MKIDQPVLEVLNHSIEVVGPRLLIKGQLDRKLYTKVNEVLEALGGKWNRKEKAHVFAESDDDVQELLDATLLSGEVETLREHRKQYGFFPTPEEVGQTLVKLAGVETGMEVLEPSAGEGALVTQILRAGANCVMCELDHGRWLKLSLRMTKSPGRLKLLDQHDFMKVPVEPRFDAVVMNPSFQRGAHLEQIRHAFAMLSPGGKLVTVCPAGIVKRNTDRRHREFNEWLAEQRWHEEDLPPDAFKASGTNVRTQILVIEQP